MYLIDPRYVKTIDDSSSPATNSYSTPSEQRVVQTQLSKFDGQMAEVLNDGKLVDEEKLRRYLEILRRHILSTRQLDQIMSRQHPPPKIIDGGENGGEQDGAMQAKKRKKITKPEAEHLQESEDGADEETIDEMEKVDGDDDWAYSHIRRKDAQHQSGEPMFSERNILAELPESHEEMATNLLRNLKGGKFDGKQ